MADKRSEHTKGLSLSIPHLILITTVIAVVVNGYLLYFSQTEIFDPLFYIPIILAAYYYPKRGIPFAGACAVLYLLMVMVVPGGSRESALASLGHAGIFILIGSFVSGLRMYHVGERAAVLPFRRPEEPFLPSLLESGLIRNIIILGTVVAVVVNVALLFLYGTLIFDPLFFFPVILVAYFYPRHGVIAATLMALLLYGIVPIGGAGYPGIVATGLLHAGILIITGFVVSAMVTLYSSEQEIHKRLAEIVESSHDAIIGETLDGVITDWNAGAERLYGYRAGEVVGKSISLLVPPDRPDEIPRLLRKIGNGETIKRLETERITRDGRRIWVSLALSPIKDETGEVIGASVIAIDITDRKLAEIALEQANKKIHMLGRITRHDILNQVTVLNIYHNLAETTTGDETLLLYLDRAKKAADAINQLVQFTAEYQEIGEEKPQWFAVQVFFAEASARYKDRPVSFSFGCPDVEVYADPLIRQAFYRLIDHSLNFGGGVTVIRCSCAEDAGGLAIVYEDNGTKTPVGSLERLFDKTSADGSGSGLFLAREILSITGITITGNGGEGGFARFEIRVPPGAYRFTGSREP